MDLSSGELASKGRTCNLKEKDKQNPKMVELSSREMNSKDKSKENQTHKSKKKHKHHPGVSMAKLHNKCSTEAEEWAKIAEESKELKGWA